MKFAKELERELVPEWRAKYLNYKLGKKKLKAISRALRNATQQTPRDPPKRLAHSTPVTSAHALHRADIKDTENSDDTNEDAGAARPRDIPGIGGPREALIKRSEGNDEAPFPLTRYGSILGSPPLRSRGGNLSSLALPDPAIDPDHPDPPPNKRRGSSVSPPTTPKRHVPHRKHSSPAIPPPRSNSQANFKGIFQAKRTYISPVTEGSRVQLKKVLSLGTTAIVQDADVPLEAYKDIDTRQQEFFQFLDQELEKIGAFYKEKEDEATKRLVILREQLHSMRDRRLEEITTSRSHKVPVDQRQQAAADALVGPHLENGESESKIWSNPLDAVVQAAKKIPDKIAHSRTPSKASNSIADLGTPRQFHDRRDYARRQEPTTVPYRTAKRKLKVALQEYYRGLELLKSYALLNRTAFRKINKKYDKTVNARPAMRYMNEKVNQAWFVKSDVIENYIHATEDLYARYFYSGNHKVAIGKLRVKSARAGDYTDSTFRNGIFLATGAVFGIQGLVQASSLARSSDAMLKVHTSFLLQLYAGYFLMLLLFLLFCVDCRLWSTQKINYGFVFEFDSRTQLDWRQLCEIPSFFFFLEGLFVWVNFNRYGGDSLYVYYPVILFFVTLVVMFFPARVLYHHSRKWFAYTLWRLALAGIYPVEFRDFFVGDMFCSLTYAMGNIELFFCLYAQGWTAPAQCNSSHSRLLGFFTTLPSIWRAFQCIRRYHDTRNVFPHLVNCGKYTASILFYMTLSMYRIEKTLSMKSLFIAFATINGLYTSVWDLLMDFSLLDPQAKRPFLRNYLGYKHVWMYYVVILLDPILRFNWIFYAIYGNDLQHSAILSFIIGLSEVFRRGMWTILRVENEHCTNVGRFRASRDIPLPYSIPATSEESFSQSPSAHEDGETRRRPPSARSAQTGTGASTDQDGAHLEAQGSHTRSIGDHGTPLQRNISRTTTFLHAAHAQDFERKRMPELGERNVPDADDDEEDDDDDEDEFEDTSSDGLGRQSADERPSHGKARTRSTLDRAMDLESERERRS